MNSDASAPDLDPPAHSECVEIMPTRASHLPSYIERRALQELRSRGELSARNLLPTGQGQQTIIKMMAKGWIESGGSTVTYRLTPTGEVALRAQLPMHRSK
jgi:hypothetical protein